MKPFILIFCLQAFVFCGDYKDPYADQQKTDSSKTEVTTDGKQPSKPEDPNQPIQPSIDGTDGTTVNPNSLKQESGTLQEVIALLSDHRLQKFNQYNSGSNGEGTQSTTWIDLCAGGTYFVESTSSVYINGNLSEDKKQEQGTWQVKESGNEILLVFRTESAAEPAEVQVSFQDGKLFLGGDRWFRVPKGDQNGPTSCL